MRRPFNYPYFSVGYDIDRFYSAAKWKHSVSHFLQFQGTLILNGFLVAERRFLLSGS